MNGSLPSRNLKPNASEKSSTEVPLHVVEAESYSQMLDARAENLLLY